ncbi:MAG: lipopolysaccharide kinase InaA family protein [Planctomycetes bacterium]|nr:lipopolysaccharide kinase InaA family protein [Planctomycetota bacterium]
MIAHDEVAPGWQNRLAALGLNRIADLLHQPLGNGALPGCWEALCKPGLGGRQRWRWVLDQGHDGATVYLKRYTQTPLSAQLDRIRRQSARHSRASWEYQQSLRLTKAHIPVPRAVGFAEEMRGLLERRSVVLLEQAEGDGFDRVWTRAERDGAAVARGLARHDIAARLGRFIAAFHQTGFCHRDLYLCHVFVRLDRAGRQPPRFTLIDLARTHRPRWRRARWIIKDLSQLDCSARQIGASRTDRLRCLLAYLGLGTDARRVHWYAHRIVRKSSQILRRIERRSSSGPKKTN